MQAHARSSSFPCSLAHVSLTGPHSAPLPSFPGPVAVSRRGQSSLLRRIAQWKPSCIKTGGEGAESTEEKHIENMSNDEIERAMRGLKEAFLKWERQVIEVRYEVSIAETAGGLR